jgi:hypothetical protein
MHAASTRTWHAVVAVRVPRDSPDDLVRATCRRLASVDCLDAVDVTSVRGIEPALAATVVTVAVTVSTASSVTDATLRRKLEAAPGCQRVDTVSPG